MKEAEEEGKAKMLPLKLVRSLVLGEPINNPLSFTLKDHHHTSDDLSDDPNHTHGRRRRRRRRRNGFESKTPALLFVPTKEIVVDTYRLASISRELGMDLYPTPTLSHIVFSFASSTSPSTPSSFPSTWSFSSSSSASESLLNDAVPIPFPSLTTASLTHLRYFAALSKGFFKLVYFNSGEHDGAAAGDSVVNGRHQSNWDCCSVSLYSRLTGDRIDTMEGFCRTLAGKGWTFCKTMSNPSSEDAAAGGDGRVPVYLFRKVDVNRVRVGDGTYRMRELRLPHLNFRNAPLRILQYILLMTDDIFCLA